MASTLVVAPMVDGEYGQSEISSLVNILDANLLLGSEATSRNLIDKLNSRQWEIIWFIAHGTVSGIMLHDGEIDSGVLTSFIRNAEPELVVLNTCQSIDVAMAIHNEVATNFICTLSDVPDRQAFFTGRQLAISIANGYSYHRSYKRSISGQNRDYIFLAGSDDMARDNEEAEIFREKIAVIQQQLTKIVGTVYGDIKWNQPGLVNIVKNLRDSSEKQKLLIICLIATNLLIISSAFMYFQAAK